MGKYTVFYDQINRTNFQVKATNSEEARIKADKLHERYRANARSYGYAQDGWLVESDGENK